MTVFRAGGLAQEIWMGKGVPIRQIKSIHIEGSKQTLAYQRNAPVVDLLKSANPIGKVMITHNLGRRDRRLFNSRHNGIRVQITEL